MFRPDAACWGALGLSAVGTHPKKIDRARQSLVRIQQEDGRVPISPTHPEVCWPTALAVLAWEGAPDYVRPQERAIRFLLDVDHVRPAGGSESSLAPDEQTGGWPWTMGTHSWVEPTAYSLLALQASGNVDHRRCRKAVQMMLGRQFPEGGWNGGETITLGRVLRPMPETSGMALTALAGLVDRETIQPSFDYLRSEWVEMTTPLSVAWTVLAFRAWGEPLDGAEDRIVQVLDRKRPFRPLGTVALSLLLLAWHVDTDLVGFVRRTGSRQA
jgi:hypothetical protein